MSGLTWLHISDWLRKGEKEFDRQVIRAALIGDIVGRTATDSNLSMIDLLDPLLREYDVGRDWLFMISGSPDISRTVFGKLPSDIKMPLDLRMRYTKGSEDRCTWTEKSRLNYWA